MKRKKQMFLLMSGLALLMSGTVSSSLINKNRSSSDLPLISKPSDSNGVTFRKIYYGADPSALYGRYEFTYSIEPIVYTDSVGIKLNFSDGSLVPVTIMSLKHDVYERKVSLFCNSVFLQQITLTLYAEANPNISGSIHLDFRERLTVTLPDSINIEENKIPSISPTITSTGGSILADKNVVSVNYKWNDAFVAWVKQRCLEYIKSYQDAYAMNMSFSNTSFSSYLALNNSDCAAFFAEAFNPSSFLSSKGCAITYDYEYSDDDSGATNTTHNVYLKDLSRNDLLAQFDGINPIVDYSCSIDNKIYKKTFGIKLSAINMTKITISGGNHVF